MNDSTFDKLLQATKPVRYAATAALAVLSLFVLALAIQAFNNLDARANPYQNTITVEGTGKAASVPNIADITFSVMQSAATVADAQAAATKQTNDALDAVKQLGVDDKDVKTVAYNVYPQYASTPCYGGICPNSSKITGYQVSQTIEVKVRDTAKAGDVLSALGTLNVQNISGPNFTVDEADADKNEARAEAIKNAQAKAQELAKELHVSLGKVVSFYENTGPVPYGYGKGGAADVVAAEMAPSLPTGENETSVTVSITYEIR